MRSTRLAGARASRRARRSTRPTTAQLRPHAAARTSRAARRPPRGARSPLEGIVVQWARALPEVALGPDGSMTIDPVACDAPPVAVFDAEAHAGLLGFLDAAE